MTIEHSPIETNDQAPSLVDVVREAVAQALPCPVCDRTEPCRCLPPADHDPLLQRATFVIAALRLYSYLPPEEAQEEAEHFNAEDAALWLGHTSGFIRYADEGWRKLLQSTADVDVAAAYALKIVPTADVDYVKNVRSALLNWHRTQ